MSRVGTPIRVATVEDDARYRASLEMLLRHTEDFSLAASFSEPAAVLERLRTPAAGGEPEWDLVLMDLDMPGMSGVECTRQLKARRPGVAVVILTVFEEREHILEAICAGADGYLLKRTSADELLDSLRAVMAGGSPLSAGVARTVLETLRQINAGAGEERTLSRARIELTARERAVLRCLVQGMSYKAAGAELGISIDTVRSHIRGIYGKLQVHSVAEAVSRALKERLV